MKVALSYFAQLRNFKPNMVPISTAISDPKWFHGNKGANYKFIDNKGVLNGVRCKNLAPNSSCSTLCAGRTNCVHVPSNCEFLQRYKAQLEHIPTHEFRDYCERVAKSCASVLNIPVDNVVLVFMVYEKYDNPCSERSYLLEFLNRCGYDASELEYPIA